MHLTLKEFMHMHQTFKPFLVPLDEILERLSLPTDVRLSKFSTGMIQRVKLAQACYSRSKLVALDEPMSNLDEEENNGLNRFCMAKSPCLTIGCS